MFKHEKRFFKSVNIKSECLGCMMNQVKNAFSLLQSSTDNDKIVDVQKKIMGKFSELDTRSAPIHGKVLYDEIAKEMGVKDPYYALKKKYNTMAMELVPKLMGEITNSEQPLLTAFSIAIMGNVIDFGAPHDIDLHKEVEQFSLEHLKINDFDKLQGDLESAKKVFIVGDNCGEIVFDKIMIEHLIKSFPKIEFTYAVRGGPAINDSTLEDAKFVGLTDINGLKIVEGSASPGVIMELTSPEYQKVFQEADVILSKGQGNFESLDNVPIKKGANLYFLLKAKCDVVAKAIGVPLLGLVLKQRI